MEEQWEVVDEAADHFHECEEEPDQGETDSGSEDSSEESSHQHTETEEEEKEKTDEEEDETIFESFSVDQEKYMTKGAYRHVRGSLNELAAQHREAARDSTAKGSGSASSSVSPARCHSCAPEHFR